MKNILFIALLLWSGTGFGQTKSIPVSELMLDKIKIVNNYIIDKENNDAYYSVTFLFLNDELEGEVDVNMIPILDNGMLSQFILDLGNACKEVASGTLIKREDYSIVCVDNEYVKIQAGSPSGFHLIPKKILPAIIEFLKIVKFDQ